MPYFILNLSVHGLSSEEKLLMTSIRPSTLGSAKRIQGLTATGILTLLKHVRYKNHAVVKPKFPIHGNSEIRRCYTTVNSTEINHFENLANSWWNTLGPSKLLHRMNPVRLEFINYLQNTPSQPKWLHGKTAIDIGCGGGILTESIARLGASTLGIDASAKMIKIAKAHASIDKSLLNLEYQVTQIDEVKKAFDLVLCMEVIEHVDSPLNFLKLLSTHVKPGGWIVMSTISRTALSWFGAIFMAERVFKIVPNGTHDFHKFINPHELKQHFNQQGWTNSKIADCFYNPFDGRWILNLESNPLGIHINYFFAVQRPF